MGTRRVLVTMAMLMAVCATAVTATASSGDDNDGGLFAAGSFAMNGREVLLSSYAGSPVLVVNVASECGLTEYMYTRLVRLARAAPQLRIIGFPSNEFGGQEPRSSSAIRAEMAAAYRVTFPLADKIEVNGARAHPVFKWLVAESGGEDIAWNFTVFLVNGDGRLEGRFEPGEPFEAIEAAVAGMMAEARRKRWEADGGPRHTGADLPVGHGDEL